MAFVLLAQAAWSAAPDSQVAPASYTTGKSGGQLKWLPIRPADENVKQTAGIEEIVVPAEVKKLPLAAPAAELVPAPADDGAQGKQAACPDTRKKVNRAGATVTEDQFYKGLLDEVKPPVKAGEAMPISCTTDIQRPYDDRCSWARTTFTWKASALSHKPAYFEDEALERDGHSWGPWIEPFVSGGHFYIQLPILPYIMGLYPPNECIYTLGYYRMGDCSPYMFDPLPLSIRAALLEGGVWTGGVFLDSGRAPPYSPDRPAHRLVPLRSPFPEPPGRVPRGLVIGEQSELLRGCMKRKPIIVGNWKMNTSRSGAAALARDVAKQATGFDHVELAVCPPSVYVDAVAGVLKGTPVGWGVQNVYHQPNGAFTGEISVAMVQDLGCQYAILGHSERRQFLGETDEDVNRKLMAVLAVEGLTPIVCVGERLEQREAGQTLDVIRRQIEGSLAGLLAVQMGRVVIAYEPVWAIGTGRTATPEQAEEVHLALRTILQGRYNKEVAEAVRIQYGGSVKADNAQKLLAQPNIDGALVGGASLKVGEFMGIVAAAGR